MSPGRLEKEQRARWKGQTLVLVAMGLVMIIAMAGLAIDLASLYVARSEAQRAADAAALAGADAILDSGYPSGAVDAATAQTLARQRAVSVGNQNSVGEIIPIQDPDTGIVQDTGLVQPGDVAFNFSNPRDPRITVLVQRTAERGNAVPTFFMKIFGVHTADVSADATAEVYFGTKCVKPWMIPNCDKAYTVPAVSGVPSGPDAGKANTNCPTVDASGKPILDADGKPVAFYEYYVYPGSLCDPTVQNCILNKDVYGRWITIKSSQPNDAPAPGKFYPIYLEPGFTPAACPDCAKGPSGGGTPSGSVYRENIACCNQKAFTGGFEVVAPITGNMVGPTASGVDCLIHETNNGAGQDWLDTSTYPFQYRAGANNPLVVGCKQGPCVQPGDVIADSDSVVSVPLFDGSSLCPGFQNCPATATVNLQGFLLVFLQGETNGTVTGYILGVAPAGAPPASPGNAFTVRLIHN
jgi:Putative Flp pilus-assembly TadE/G-like